MLRSEKLMIGKIGHNAKKCWRASVCAELWHCVEKYGEQVHAVNFGTARKNDCVQVRTLNLALHGVHTH
jgi:hypothetical protein